MATQHPVRARDVLFVALGALGGAMLAYYGAGWGLAMLGGAAGGAAGGAVGALIMRMTGR